MYLIRPAVVALVLAGESLAFPSRGGEEMAKCENPTQRKAWHTLSDDEKRAYIDAELCVMELPGTLDLPGAISKYDELAGNHQIQARLTHGTGTFLPYHRYFLYAHEVLLRECGFKGGLPYWNETLDIGAYADSPLFDAELGFGGNGEGPDGCLASGPFAGRMTPVGPGFNTTVHCVNRNWNLELSFGAAQEEVDACSSLDTFEEAHPCFYGAPHLAGHAGIGGIMGDALVSPSDPVFYLHHGFVDKIWWDWQAAKPETRLYDISGLNTQPPELGFPEFEGDVEEENDNMFGWPTDEMIALTPSSKAGDKGGDIVTLDHVLSTLGIIPDVPVRDVMDIGGEYLCYEYV